MWKSSTIKLYHRWLRGASREEAEFVDSVYEACEKNYDAGGDLVVECYDPDDVVMSFKTLADVRELCGLRLEKALDCREGTDLDPELAAKARYDIGWKD